MVRPARPEDAAQARELALELGLPLRCCAEPGWFNLVVGREGLAVHPPRAWRMRALVCDFERGRAGYRLAAGRPAHNLLARALGRTAEPQRIVDATAGLGVDGLGLAALGHQVVLLERHPLVAALLGDGLRRASAGPLGPVLKRVQWHCADALQWLPAHREPLDVVYLDPMFPDREVRARREMQILQRLVGGDPDGGGLLEAALARAGRRVVVKRPRRAPALGPRKPDFSVEGRSTRFDVYLTGSRHRESL